MKEYEIEEMMEDIEVTDIDEKDESEYVEVRNWINGECYLYTEEEAERYLNSLA